MGSTVEELRARSSALLKRSAVLVADADETHELARRAIVESEHLLAYGAALLEQTDRQLRAAREVLGNPAPSRENEAAGASSRT